MKNIPCMHYWLHFEILFVRVNIGLLVNPITTPVDLRNEISILNSSAGGDETILPSWSSCCLGPTPTFFCLFYPVTSSICLWWRNNTYKNCANVNVISCVCVYNITFCVNSTNSCSSNKIQKKETLIALSIPSPGQNFLGPYILDSCPAYFRFHYHGWWWW